ncbi:MAG: MerR family transcriptional regulator [Clostridia bacterium]|nr:MerR family transcriptional regulator [Clostridia bacterium]
MLKIGDFSKLSMVSVRMLRHYDKIGLLKPVQTDEFTGYRYYDEQQLLAMGRISALKNMGFSLSVIGEILPFYDDKEKMEKFFLKRKSELIAEYQETAEKLALLTTAMEQLRKDDTMKYDVILKTISERQVASVRKVIPSYNHEGTLWHILFKETDSMNMRLSEPPMHSAVLHDREYKENNVDVEVQVAVDGSYTDTENVHFKTEPEMQVVSITFKGAYSQFGDVYAQLAAWVNRNGYEFCGPMFDMYHVSPHDTQNSEEFVTEVCCPVIAK